MVAIAEQPVDECQQFKAAFLHACVQDGLNVDQIHDLVRFGLNGLEKDAGFLGDAFGIAKDVGSVAAPIAAGAFVGIPALAGAVGGTTLAGLTNLGDEDPEEIKIKEKVQAYRRASEQLELQKRLHSAESQHRPTRPLY
jgi:hypothetical protein